MQKTRSLIAEDKTTENKRRHEKGKKLSKEEYSLIAQDKTRQEKGNK